MTNEIKCPICIETPLYPRLYECGHTVCEICMQNHDHAETDRNYNIFQATNFTCPICRQSSISPWYTRPINRALLDILLRDSEYIKKHEEYVAKRIDIKTQDLKVPENLDLSFLSKRKRKEMCDTLYDKLMPIIFEAATFGKTHVILTEIAADIKIVSDLLSEKLFKHNIYKMITSSRECTIEIVPSDKNYNCEFENPDYNNNSTNVLFLSNIERVSNLSSSLTSTVSSILSPVPSPEYSPPRLSPRRRSRRNY